MMFDRLKMRLARSIISKAIADSDAMSSAITEALVKKQAPPARNTREQLLAYANTPWVKSLASRVASSFAAVQWELVAPVNGYGKAYRSKSLERMPIDNQTKKINGMRKAGEIKELDDHPMLDMLYGGNPFFSGNTCRELLCLHLDLCGTAYWALARNVAGTPVQIWPTPPHWVVKHPTASSPVFEIRANGETFSIAKDDMITFVSPNPENPYGNGIGLVQALGDEIDTDEYAAKYMKTFFYNNAIPSAVVSFKGGNREQIEASESSWNDKLRGVANANRVLFTNQEMQIAQLENTFKDQMVVGIREHERDICQQVWGVPPEIIGNVANSNRATIDSAIYIMAMFVLIPRLERVRDVLQQKLVPQYDDRIVLSYTSPAPDDKAYWLSKAQANPSALTRAEWREALGYESHGDIDDVYVMQLGQIERKLTGKMPYQAESATGTPKKKATKTLMEGDITRVVDALTPEYISVPVTELFADSIKEWGDVQLAGVGVTGASFDMLNPAVVAHLDNLATIRMGYVNDTTREAIRAQLVEGVNAGESSQELAGRVSSVFDEATTSRALNIARTEVVGSSNFGTHAAYFQSGVVGEKQWVATPDSRTRDSHLALNGQVQKLNDKFSIGGMSAMYPGGFGTPAMDCNCRCTHIAVVGEPKSVDQLAAVWKQYDEDLLSWEEKTEKVLRSGFRKQKAEVLDGLALYF